MVIVHGKVAENPHIIIIYSSHINSLAFSHRISCGHLFISSEQAPKNFVCAPQELLRCHKEFWMSVTKIHLGSHQITQAQAATRIHLGSHQIPFGQSSGRKNSFGQARNIFQAASKIFPCWTMLLCQHQLWQPTKHIQEGIEVVFCLSNRQKSYWKPAKIRLGRRIQERSRLACLI